MASLATAFALSDPNNPKHEQYDITVYQLGWRLGGKGASGRGNTLELKNTDCISGWVFTRTHFA